MGGRCALGSPCVCRPWGIRWLPVFCAPVTGALAFDGWRQWPCAAYLRGCGSRVAPGWRGRMQACVWVCSWCGLFGGSGHYAVWCGTACGGRWGVAGVVVPRVGGGTGVAGVGGMGLGVRYVCAQGAVDWAGALLVMQQAV